MDWTRSLAILAVAACASPPAVVADRCSRREEILGSNALMSNALMSNALMSNALMSNALMSNALMSNALTSNALMSNALMSNALRPDGFTEGQLARQFLTYVYSCAMPVGATMKLQLGAQDYGTLEGGLGLAPGWGMDGGQCDQQCQRFVTACLLARTNFWGVPVRISLRGDHPSLLPTEDEKARFPLREGAYFGNLFVNNDRPADFKQIFGCSGPGSNVPELTNRFCSGGNGVCAIKVQFECVNPRPPRSRATEPNTGKRYACRRQDPNDGLLRDCYTGGVSAFDDDPQGAHFDEAITVYLKEPVAICGDGVCTGAETPSSCPSDCSTGWARSFAGQNAPASFVGMPDGGQVIAVLASDPIDLGTGQISIVPGEGMLAVARLDAVGRTLWARQVAYMTGSQNFPGFHGSAFLRADATGQIFIAGEFDRGAGEFYDSSPVWFGATRFQPFEGGATTFVAELSPAGELAWVLPLRGAYLGHDPEPGGGAGVLVGADEGRQLVSVSGTGAVSGSALLPALPCDADPYLRARASLLVRERDGALLMSSPGCADLLHRVRPDAGTVETIPYPPSSPTDFPRLAALGPDDELFVTGAEDVFSSAPPTVKRLAHDGTLLWESPALPPIGGLAASEHGALAVFGTVSEPATLGAEVLVPVGYPTSPGSNPWIAKFRSDGILLWAKVLGGLGESHAQAAQIDAEGTVWVTGAFSQPGAFDGWILDASADSDRSGDSSTFLLSMPDRPGK